MIHLLTSYIIASGCLSGSDFSASLGATLMIRKKYGLKRLHKSHITVYYQTILLALGYFEKLFCLNAPLAVAFKP